jgi:hypothetical protein
MNRRAFLLGLVTLLVLTATGCLDPKDRRPGLGLSGEVVSDAISDWSFSDDHPEIFLETKTWYMIPHSVTTVCAAVGDKLYVPTLYYQGGEWPDKVWNANVEADPRVRLQIGDKIYEREARVVEDPAEIQIALDALAAKYPFWREQLSKPESERPDMAMVRMDPRSSE